LADMFHGQRIANDPDLEMQKVGHHLFPCHGRSLLVGL
jgi:hypothetical protein